MSDSDDRIEFNARALFQHLADERGADGSEEYEWVFRFSHANSGKLQSAMEAIGDAFTSEVEIDPNEPIGSFDDAPMFEDEDGTPIEGPPELTIEFCGQITEPALSRLHEKFQDVSKRLGIEYLGVECYDLG